MMTIYPNTYFTDIEFDQIITLAADYTRGPLARRHILQSFPYSDFRLWRTELNTIQILTEWKRAGVTHKRGTYDDIGPHLTMVRIGNYNLDLEAVLTIRQVLDEVYALNQWSEIREVKGSPLYEHYFSRIDPSIAQLKQDLDRIFYPDGEVREDASPALQRLFKQLKSQ